MNKNLLLTTAFGIVLLMQSCLVSRGPQRDLRDMNAKGVSDVYTVRVPMFIARPVAKTHLKDESAAKEWSSYMNRIKAVRVTMAVVRSDFDMYAFRTMVTKQPYQEWMNINAYGNTVYINVAEKDNSIRKINVVVAAKNNALVYAMIKCKLSQDELSGLINLALSDEKMMMGLLGSSKAIAAL